MIASWRNMCFSISEEQVKPLSELSTNYKLKTITDSETGENRPRGLELQPLTISYEVAKPAGVDPYSEYLAWEKQLGQKGSFYLGNRRFGTYRFILDSVELTSNELDNYGDIIIGTIELQFEEFSSERADDRSPIDRLQILYQGKDIYGSISVNECIHDMYASSRSDELLIKFNDTQKLWDSWNPESKDTIEVIYGTAKTGKMYIESVKPENGTMTLRAYSVPKTAKDKTSKAWEQVKFLQLAEEIAKRNNLSFESYGVTDQTYSYVSQQSIFNGKQNDSIEDFLFLEERCLLESASFLVYNGTLVVYNEEELEHQKPMETWEIPTNENYEYTNDTTKKFGKAEITSGNNTYYFLSQEKSEKILQEVVVLAIDDEEEGNRFAKGILRYRNKNNVVGVRQTNLLQNFAAGSVVNIKTEGANSWDGAAFIYHLRHDYVNEKSKVFLRKPLGGY